MNLPNVFQRYRTSILFVITGTQNSGKSLLMNELVKEANCKAQAKVFESVVIHTTGSKSPKGLVSITKPVFKEIKERDGFLEYNCDRAVWYGLTSNEVEKVFKKGKHAVVLTSVEAARTLKLQFGSSVHVIYYANNEPNFKNQFGIDVVQHKREENLHVNYIAASMCDTANARVPLGEVA
jgi:guanylate kinase